MENNITSFYFSKKYIYIEENNYFFVQKRKTFVMQFMAYLNFICISLVFVLRPSLYFLKNIINI